MTQFADLRLRERPSLTVDVASDREFAPKALVFLLVHVVLAFVMQGSQFIATVHAFLTLGIGLFFLADKRPDRLIYLTGYIIGADLLWRGTGAHVFWEIAKYAASAFLLLSLVVHRSFTRPKLLVFAYFLGMVPSIYLAIDRTTGFARQMSLIDMPFELLGLDREAIAYNLGGPFLLMVATLYFSTIKLSRAQFMKLSVAILGPISGLLALAIGSTLSLSSDILQTIYASSDLTSADIGPNQMSSMLGLGMLLTIILFSLIGKESKGFRTFVLALALAFGVQTMLTFSRGGLWAAVGALLAALFFWLRDPQARGRLVVSGILAVLLLNFVILPALDYVTAGHLRGRLQDIDLTRRDEIIREELAIYENNMFIGVGPGQAQYAGISGKPAHTEYTRVLAEHGLFGVFSLVILARITFSRLLKPAPPSTKGITISLTVWTLLFFFHSATRLAAPSFTFGLAAAVIQSEDYWGLPSHAGATDNE